MFNAGESVSLKDDPSRGGTITGVSEVRRNRIYWEVILSDGSGRSKFPEGQLVGGAREVNPLEELRAGRFTDPDRLRRSLLHHRLTGRLRDIIYSMDVTDTDFHAYQFKPVVKLLASPSQGLLIADEVGLGKTIEAGLVWTELVARFDASRLLVVCPKSLTEKWRLELWQKFSVDAKIVGAGELLDHLKRDGEGGDGFALIASISSIRPPRDWDDGTDDGDRARLCRFLSDAEGLSRPLFDCVIFDEAHHLRNAGTLAHTFARVAMQVSDYKLLLSATPINLRSEDLRTLLSLVDPDSFDSAFAFSAINDENKPLVRARDLALDPKTDFAELLGELRGISSGVMLRIDRQLENLKRELAAPDLADSRDLRVRIAAMLEEMSLLGSVVNRTRRRDVNDLQVKREVDHLPWSMSPAERMFYDAASDIVRQHAFELSASERFLLATPQRLIASSLAAACRHWGSMAEDFSEDDEDDALVHRSTGPLTTKLARLCASPELQTELAAADTKLRTLFAAIKEHDVRGDRKVIVFSSFRTTLDYLAQKLRENGIVVDVMHGGIKEERTQIVGRFADSDGQRVLLTSEVGGEGLDMQFCRSLINYDLPWNPMKVEQRIGRIDRIGQKSERINVLSLIATDTIEERIYLRLFMRLLEIQETLGTFESILGKEIGELEQRLLDPELSGEDQQHEIERSATAFVVRQQQTEKLEEEAPGLIAHGDMILAQIEANRRPERRIAAAELADYVHEAIASRYPGSRVDEVPGQFGIYDVKVSESAHLALKRLLGRGGRSRTKLGRSTSIRAVFERTPGLSKSVEIVTNVHPLVRLAAKIRNEAAKTAVAEPVIAVKLAAAQMPDLAPGSYIAAAARWTVDGAIRIDRIFYGACDSAGNTVDAMQAERLVQAALRCGNANPQGQPDRLISAAEHLISETLESAFDDFLDEEEARHEDRADTASARIDSQEEKRRREMEAKIYDWKVSGEPKKLKMIPAVEGKLAKLVARLAERREQLRSARARFSHNNHLIGLIAVELV